MKYRFPVACGFLLLAVAFAGPPVSAQFQIETAARDYSFTISTAQPWTDTGVDLQAGDVLQLHSSSGENCDPAGVTGASSSGAPVVSAPAGALIARLQPQGVPVLVGSGKQLKADGPGHLYLGVNASGEPPCSGSFAVKVHISPAAAPSTSVPGNSLTANSTTGTSTSASTPAAASAGAQKPATTQDMKSKLASAAQVFLAGQFGNGATASPTSSSAVPAGNDVVTPTSTSTATASTPVALKLSSGNLDSWLAKRYQQSAPAGQRSVQQSG